MLLNFINEYICDGYINFTSNDNIETNKERYVYVLKDDKVLKLYITIDEHLIYENFRLLKNNLTKKDFTYVDYDKFKDNKFPLTEYEFEHTNILKFNKYKIPNKNSLNSTLLYILNNIYNSYMINSDMLNDLSEEYKFRYNECNNMDKLDRIWIEVIQNVINNLEDYKAFLFFL